MPRLPRIYCPDAVYYVILSGNPREALFKDDDDRRQYLELVKKYKEQYEFKLFAYLLLPTKIYLIIEPSPEVNISQIMHAINSLYSKYFNSRYQRSGHLFRERFKAILVEKETYLNELTRHVHLNPVYLKFSPDAEAYPWSSYRVYSSGGDEGELRSQGFVDTGDVLSHFSGSYREQQAAYRDFVTGARSQELENFKKKISRAWIVGSKSFIKEARNLTVKKKAVSGRTESGSAESRKPLSFPAQLAAFLKSQQFALVSLTLILTVGFMIVKARQKVSEIVRKEVDIEYAEKEKATLRNMQRAKEVLKQNLEEKYQADKLSYQAMMKKLDMERKSNEAVKKGVKDL